MNKENTPKGSAMTAFLIGAVAGGITALLFAPQSGAQMRGRLKRGAHDLREKGKHIAHDVEERADTVTGAMRSAASEAKSTYRNEIEKQREARVASGQETKRYAETEIAGIKPRTGAQS